MHREPGRARAQLIVLTIAIAASAATGPAAANNGLNMIGFGTESIGTGGADLAEPSWEQEAVAVQTWFSATHLRSSRAALAP
jgi:hypothetical protein